MKTCICTRQAGGPVPSHVWAHVGPTPLPKGPLPCDLPLSRALAPGEEWEGQSHPLLLFFGLSSQLSGLSLSVLQVCVYLLTLRIAAHGHILHPTGFTHHAVLLVHAPRDADGHPQLHMHTHLLTFPLLCAYVQIQCGLRTVSFITLTLFLEKAHSTCPPLLIPGVPTL